MQLSFVALDISASIILHIIKTIFINLYQYTFFFCGREEEVAEMKTDYAKKNIKENMLWYNRNVLSIYSNHCSTR